MSFTTRVTKTVTEGGTTITNTNTHVHESVIKLQETIADATTDQQFPIAIDLTYLDVVTLQSTVAMSVATNDASTGTPQETFTLAAGEPFIWELGQTPVAFLGDVTDFYITNASGGAGVLNVIVSLNLSP